jgi:pimeloyl-ACP methyl ester carboxylesterase
VIALDWPGHGLSSAGTVSLDSIRTQPVAWMQAVVDAFGLDTFELVGHSLGGQFALYYAVAHPERVRSLTLLGIPGAAFPGLKAPVEMRAMLVPAVARWVLSRPVSRDQYEQNSAITLGPGAVQPWPRELVDVGWYASQRRAFVDSIPSYYGAIASTFGVQRTAVLSDAEFAQLTMPVLALLGEHDVFMSVDAAAPALAAIPDATLVRVEGGHAPWLNSPEASADAVRSFLGG